MIEQVRTVCGLAALKVAAKLLPFVEVEKAGAAEVQHDFLNAEPEPTWALVWARVPDPRDAEEFINMQLLGIITQSPLHPEWIQIAGNTTASSINLSLEDVVYVTSFDSEEAAIQFAADNHFNNDEMRKFFEED